MRILVPAILLTISLLVPGISHGAMPVSEESIKIANFELLKPLNAELVEHSEVTARAARLIVLGALEKVNHVLEPEESIFVTGTRKTLTYFLPDESRTRTTGLFFRQQLSELGTIRYECTGRTCGSSSYWANKIFKEKVLYGPEQFQRYYVAALDRSASDSAETNISKFDESEQGIVNVDSESAYLMIYVGQRATGKIYLHIVYVEP